jgi:hypothetical protein
MVSAYSAGQGNPPTRTYTDIEGKYSLLVPTGTYTVDVSTSGYQLGIKHTIIVNENEAIGINVQLKKLENTSTSSQNGLVDYAIQYGIQQGIVGGEITIPQDEPESITVYDARVSLSLSSTQAEQDIRFSITGPAKEKGTVIALRIDNPNNVLHSSIGHLQDVVVEYDGVPIEMVTNGQDLFGSIENSSNPSWSGSLTDKLYVFVRVPSFSEHEITIRSLSGLSGISSILSLFVYGLVSIVVIVVLLLPMIVNIVRRRGYFRKK